MKLASCLTKDNINNGNYKIQLPCLKRKKKEQYNTISLHRTEIFPRCYCSFRRIHGVHCPPAPWFLMTFVGRVRRLSHQRRKPRPCHPENSNKLRRSHRSLCSYALTGPSKKVQINPSMSHELSVGHDDGIRGFFELALDIPELTKCGHTCQNSQMPIASHPG